MIRSFVALGVPDEVRETLSDLGAELRGGRPVAEENLHLTLAFLDDQDEAVLEELNEALAALFAVSFDLTINGLGTFGRDKPRAVWAGVKPEPKLVNLQKAVAGACRRTDISLPARRFVPHITLTRFPNAFREDEVFQRFLAAHAALSLPPFTVRSFGLYSSTPGRGGPIYEELAQYPLVHSDPA